MKYKHFTHSTDTFRVISLLGDISPGGIQEHLLKVGCPKFALLRLPLHHTFYQLAGSNC